MNALARFEAACARLVEGTFARIFPNALDPVYVGRKLIAAQSASSSDTFLVHVHPIDHERFVPERAALEARWSELLREASGGDGRAQAILREDASVVAGSVRIESVVDERKRTWVLMRVDGSAIVLHDGLSLGRSDDNDVVLSDARCSRRHARILAEGNGYVIEDLGSTNGTFVDDQRVLRAKLERGARVQLGDERFDVRD